MKIYLTYGAAMAIAGAVLNVVFYLLGLHSDPAKLSLAQVLGICLGLPISVVCLVLGIKARRAEVPPTEEFSYGRALGAGVMISLFAGLFGMVTTYVYAAFINPEFVDVIVRAQVQGMEAKGLSAAQTEGAEKMIRAFSGPTAQTITALVGSLIFGTVISLIAAAFLKREAAPELLESPPPIN